MRSIQHPLARDETGALHWAETAPRDRAYTCPACQAPMILRRGEVRVAHFAHAHAPAAMCSPQRMLRMVAAMAISNVLTAWRTGTGERPQIERRCATCGQWVSYPLPARSATCQTSDNGIVLIRDATGTDLAAIVAIIDDSPPPSLAVADLTIPWGTVDARAIIRQPTRWVIAHDTFHPIRCKACRGTTSTGSRLPTPPDAELSDPLPAFQATAAAVASAADPPIELPTRYYRYAITTCPACARAALVFGWPGMRDGAEPMVQPRPATIRRIPSRIIANAHEWFTICPHCRMALDSCFTAAPTRSGRSWIPVSLENNDAAWHRDMVTIAREWTNTGASACHTDDHPRSRGERAA